MESDTAGDASIFKTEKYKKEIKIILLNSNDKKIGYIKGVILKSKNIFKELKSKDVLKVLEFKDKEEEEEIKSFYIQVLSKENLKDNIFYITELFIEKEFRGNGLGTKIFDRLPKYLKENINKNIKIICLMPGPLEKINGKVEYIYNNQNINSINLKNKLIHFYTSLGFIKIGKTEFYKIAI